MYKIAITGPESTGKSYMSKALAEHYNCDWVQEFARDYLTIKEGKYKQEDLTEILGGQLNLESKAEVNANKFLFCDTDPLVILIWSSVKFNSVDNRIEKAWKKQSYDLHLLLYPDLPWEYDPLRENKDDRLALFSLYEAELRDSKRPFVIIKGDEKNRVNAAIKAIDRYFNVL